MADLAARVGGLLCRAPYEVRDCSTAFKTTAPPGDAERALFAGSGWRGGSRSASRRGQ